LIVGSEVVGLASYDGISSTSNGRDSYQQNMTDRSIDEIIRTVSSYYRVGRRTLLLPKYRLAVVVAAA